MYIPTRKYRQIGKGNTFLMDEKTREKIREKNRLSKKAKTSRDPELEHFRSFLVKTLKKYLAKILALSSSISVFGDFVSAGFI
jgi:hypothetical protein